MTVLSACKKCWFVLLPVFLVSIAVVIILPFYLKELKQQNQNSNPTPEEHKGIYTSDTSNPAIRKLTDPEYGFSFEFPSNSASSYYFSDESDASRLWDQSIILGMPGEQGFRRLATMYVWKNVNGLGIIDWVEINAAQRGESAVRYAPPLPNARLAGESALFYQIPSLQGVHGRTVAIFTHEETVIFVESDRLLGEEGYESLLNVLRSFEFDGKTTDDVIPPLDNN